jgi:hypothetical protein
MLSKTRTTIITLVAAFSFGGAAIVPTASQARQKRKEASRCVGLQNLYTLDLFTLEYDKAHHASKAQIEKDENNITDDLDKGEAAGCNISIWQEQPPAKHLPGEGLRPEGEPKSLGEPASQPPTRLTPPTPAYTLR